MARFTVRNADLGTVATFELLEEAVDYARNHPFKHALSPVVEADTDADGNEVARLVHWNQLTPDGRAPATPWESCPF